MPNYNSHMNLTGMQEEQLESMYPRIYQIIYPHIRHQCDMFDSKNGMISPTRKQLEGMVEEINQKVEAEVEAEISNSNGREERQFGFGGRRILRDFISALLIRQLIGRRRPYPYPYPYFYGGYPGYFGGGFGGLY